MTRRSLQAAVAASSVTLTPGQKKFWHSVIVAFGTGALTALQIGLTTGLTSRKAVIAVLIGAAGAGLSRVAGAVLAWVNTT